MTLNWYDYILSYSFFSLNIKEGMCRFAFTVHKNKYVLNLQGDFLCLFLNMLNLFWDIYSNILLSFIGSAFIRKPATIDQVYYCRIGVLLQVTDLYPKENIKLSWQLICCYRLVGSKAILTKTLHIEFPIHNSTHILPVLKNYKNCKSNIIRLFASYLFYQYVS